MRDTMTSEQLREDLRRFLRETFLLDPSAPLEDGASLLGEGIVDSTGILELVAHLEESYGFEVRDEEIVPENFDSIESLSRYILARLGN